MTKPSKPGPRDRIDAHVYRHRRYVEDIANPQHAAVVESPGPWVLVYGNDWDGWHEYGGGYNQPETAVYEGERLVAQGGTVTVHKPKHSRPAQGVSA